MSIKKIAEKVGVSPSTVSRVLNDPAYRCQTPGLRDKIWKTAMELNYTPNEAARNLKLGVSPDSDKMYYVNVLMTHTDAGQTDPFFIELLHVIESEVHKSNCILSKIEYMPIFSDEKKCEHENLTKLVDEMYHSEKGNSDGLIVVGKCCPQAIAVLSSKYKNLVAVNRNTINYEVDEVTCDGRKLSLLAVNHLVSLGHRNIAYVGETINEARYDGYKEALKINDIPLYPDYIRSVHQTEADGYEIMEQLFKLDRYPTAIYCANDIIAVGMLRSLAKHKSIIYRPSIIGCDDIEKAQTTTPMLTTIQIPKYEMGKFALYLLLDRMRGGHRAVARLELEGKLLVRSSCYRVEDSLWSDYVI